MFTVDKMHVIYQGKEYLLIFQHASGYCEIIKEDGQSQQVKLVHFSELKFK